MVKEMNSKTFLALLVIVGVVFSFITYNKMKDFPTGNCCKDIKNTESKTCKKCDNYKWYEKAIYVWKFPANV